MRTHHPEIIPRRTPVNGAKNRRHLGWQPAHPQRPVQTGLLLQPLPDVSQAAIGT